MPGENAYGRTGKGRMLYIYPFSKKCLWKLGWFFVSGVLVKKTNAYTQGKNACSKLVMETLEKG